MSQTRAQRGSPTVKEGPIRSVLQGTEPSLTVGLLPRSLEVVLTASNSRFLELDYTRSPRLLPVTHLGSKRAAGFPPSQIHFAILRSS